MIVDDKFGILEHIATALNVERKCDKCSRGYFLKKCV
jgi:hypothetical protein